MEQDEEKTILKLDHHIGSRVLTNFYRTTAKLESKLINYSQYLSLFKGELNIHSSTKLLFRSSRDGFSLSDFHSRCDNQPKLVIIVKAQRGELFGGYTSQNINVALNSSSDSVRDNDSFTFQFDDEKLYVFRLLPSRLENALHRYSSSYLFAFSFSFWIGDNANHQTLSSSHGQTEENILPEGRLPPGKQYFGGMNFLIEDMEVFKIE